MGKFIRKTLIILLIFFAGMLLSVNLTAFAEEDIQILRLNAQLETVEYARQAGYYSALDFSSILTSQTAQQLETAKNGLELFIDEAIVDAIIEKEAFDSLINAMLPVEEVEFSDFDTIASLKNDYDELCLEVKYRVTRVPELVALIVKVNTFAASEFEDIQNELPDSVTELSPEIISQVEAVRSFYDHYMQIGALLLVDDTHFLDIETSVDNLLLIQSNQQAAAEVTSQITAIPDTVSLEDEETVETVRSNYESLSADAKALVTNYDILLAAENTITELNDYLTQAQAFDLIVTGFPDIITYEELESIENARISYNSLPETAQDFAVNYIILVEAEARLAELIAAKAVAEEIKLFINTLTDLTLDYEDRIISIRSIYEGISEDSKSFIDNYNMLLTAEARITELKQARQSALEFQPLLDNLPALIASIDEEDELSILNAGRAVDEVSDNYESLSEDAKTFVQNYYIIEESYNTVNALKDSYDALFVIDLINNIGDIITLDEKPVVESARMAYDTLSNNAKLAVTNYQVLIDAEAVILIIESGGEYTAANVENMIDGLPDTAALEDTVAIRAARALYESLSEAEKAQISPSALDKLTNSESELNVLIEQNDNAMAVINDIEMLGEITLDKETAVIDARTAYDSLTEAEKVLVDNYNELCLAEETIAQLLIAEGEAQPVIDMIALLPDDIELTDKIQIEAARTAYTALSNTAKSLVTNYNVLVAAENTIFDLELLESINETIANINAIPDIIELNTDCINTIIAARVSYDNLDSDAKSNVSNISKLIDSENAFNLLFDQENASHITLLIAALPAEIIISDEVQIKDARNGYDALSENAKSLVENLGELIIKETRLNEMKLNKDTAAAFDQAVTAIDQADSIRLIHQADIEALRLQYNDMSEEAKSFVEELVLFESLESELNALIILINSAVGLVEASISALPDADELVLADKTDVLLARSGYDALTEEAKPLVENYAKLLSSELQIYRLQKYNDFNNSISRIDYRDYEWSLILDLTEDFIEELVIATNYEDIDALYSNILDDVSELPTALDHSKQQAINEIVRYAESIGYSEAIDFSTIENAENVYDISEAADIISDTIGEIRQAQIDEAIQQSTYNIGHYITGKVTAYLEYMGIEQINFFDITEPEATYSGFSEYLKQAYGDEAVEVIILFHKEAVIKLMYAKDETAMATIEEECIENIEDIATLSMDLEAYQLKQAKANAISQLANYINEENQRKYTDKNWETLQIAVIDALSSIEISESIDEININYEAAIGNIENVEQGNYNWIVVLIAMFTGLFTLSISIFLIIVFVQQKKLKKYKRVKKYR